jgi:hypothetical protein
VQSFRISARLRLKCSAASAYSFDNGLQKTPTSSVCAIVNGGSEEADMDVQKVQQEHS